MLSRKSFIDAYCRLEGLESLDERQWDSLLRILRTKSLTASFYHRLSRKGIEALIPDYCKSAFVSAVRFADAQAHQTANQAKKLNTLLKSNKIPFIFLKGAAYTLGNTANAVGRLMTDIDICVIRDDIGNLENALTGCGWTFKEMDEHDDKYYRAWSHELPPLKNDQEGVVLDVHHTLLPPVKGRLLNISDLLLSAKTDAEYPVPSKEWLVLHSALHLMLNEDVENGLRDLTDILTLLNSNNGFEQNSASTAALFKQEGFANEWLMLLALLAHFFNVSVAKYETESLPLYYRIRVFCLKRAVLPKFSPITERFDWVWSFINFVMGYYSKMPLNILAKQAGYKCYRNSVKLIFGEYFFRKTKQSKEN